jgi:putative transposase
MARAARESCFSSLGIELIWLRSWETRRQAEKAIVQYGDGFYNRRRRHSAVGWKGPVRCKRKLA